MFGVNTFFLISKDIYINIYIKKCFFISVNAVLIFLDNILAIIMRVWNQNIAEVLE